MLLFSRQGKLRLQKWYTAYSQKEKKKTSRELVSTILSRRSKMCNFLEYRDYKVVYKRLMNFIYIGLKQNWGVVYFEVKINYVLCIEDCADVAKR